MEWSRKDKIKVKGPAQKINGVRIGFFSVGESKKRALTEWASRDNDDPSMYCKEMHHDNVVVYVPQNIFAFHAPNVPKGEEDVVQLKYKYKYKKLGRVHRQRGCPLRKNNRIFQRNFSSRERKRKSLQIRGVDPKFVKAHKLYTNIYPP